MKKPFKMYLKGFNSSEICSEMFLIAIIYKEAE